VRGHTSRTPNHNATGCRIPDRLHLYRLLAEIGTSKQPGSATRSPSLDTSPRNQSCFCVALCWAARSRSAFTARNSPFPTGTRLVVKCVFASTRATTTPSPRHERWRYPLQADRQVGARAADEATTQRTRTSESRNTRSKRCPPNDQAQTRVIVNEGDARGQSGTSEVRCRQPICTRTTQWSSPHPNRASPSASQRVEYR